MYQFSEECKLFVPADLSGIIIFLTYDYSTVFFELDVSRYPILIDERNSLNLNLFLEFCFTHVEFLDIKKQLLEKSIVVVVN
jgi:hypothetical protein